MDTARIPQRPWIRHAPVLATAAVVLAGMHLTDSQLLLPLPAVIAAVVAAAAAGRAAFRLWTDARHGWRLHARILAHVIPIGALSHVTGWGSALVPMHLVAVAGNVKHSGFETLRPTLAWAAAATLAGQLAIEAGVLPTMLGAPTAHALALMGIGASAFVGSEFATAERARRRAEQREQELTADVDEGLEKQRWLQDELQWQAENDALTGLPRRARFQAQLRETLARHDVTLLHIGLDGHPLGSAYDRGCAHVVLRELAHRIDAVCRSDGASVAHLDAVEFGVALPDVEHRPLDAAMAMARAIAAAARLPIDTGQGTVHVTVSTGIARARAGASAEAALDDGATALHAARTRGVDRVEVFDPQEHREVADRLALAADLRAGVVNQEFDLDYQPIVDLRTDRTVAAEALIRWDHPVRGRVGPDRFVPEAERSGHIAHIGRYAIEEAAWQARAWEREFGPSAPTVAVNVSARQLDDRLAVLLDEVLDDTMLDPRRLTIELTETALAPGGEEVLRRRLYELKELGIALALDDFGTGYSSLEHLERLPLDMLKIDRVFVEPAVSGDGSIARAMVDLARAMGLITVVEGIETPAQAARFRDLGCDRGQGFLFAQPLPVPMMNHHLRHGPLLAV